MPTDGLPKCVMIVAGEASGDQHGAKLVRAMREKEPSVFFCGIGGRALREAGMHVVVDAATLSVVGITEVIAKLPAVFEAMTVAKQLLAALRPDLLILIDFPEFNLRLAAAAKKLNIPVLYYISPQIWAWRPGRVKKIGRRVDHMAVILPFEADFYTSHGIPVTFVGHPLVDHGDPAGVDPESAVAVDPTLVGLLPGSRHSEVQRLLPVLLDAAARMSSMRPDLKFVVSAAPTLPRATLEGIVRRQGGQTGVTVSEAPVEDLFARCAMVVAASGTVTLQAALWGTPMVIVYKVSPVSYWLGRALIRVPSIGLINLIAQRPLVPELIQGRASAVNIAKTALALINDPIKQEQLRQALLAESRKLGGPGASARVADIALGMLYP
jgi:lipid-A-disaccharide synthase